MLLLTILIFSGCEKKLEIVPNFVATEEAALGTVDGLDAAVGLMYAHAMNQIPVNHNLWAELLSDELKYRPAAAFPNYQNYYDRNLRAVAEELVSASDLRGVSNITWKMIYNSINIASLVIRATNNDVAKDDLDFAANKDRILGECHFVRGWCHFQMLRFYGKAWGSTGDNSHPGIVTNEGPVDDRESQAKARSTVAQVYAFIIQDLIKAETLLPARYISGVHHPNYNGRAYKDAATGILARVYFQQADYGRARETINRLIGATPGSLSRHPLAGSVTEPYTTRGPQESLDNSEIILMDTAPLNANGHSALFYNQNFSFYKLASTPSAPVAATVNAVASSSLVADAFPVPLATTTDQRQRLLFRTLSTGEMMPAKYSLQDQINIPLLRSAEMVLDRAEIYALENSLDNAVRDCNATRQRAGLSPLTVPTPLNQAAVLTEIRKERRRELCFEGDRLWDLKRMRLGIPAGDRITTTVLPWDGLETVLKYFLPEMDKNPLLVNNY